MLGLDDIYSIVTDDDEGRFWGVFVERSTEREVVRLREDTIHLLPMLGFVARVVKNLEVEDRRAAKKTN